MQRRGGGGEEDDEYFPPGFTWRRKSRRSSETHASSNTSNEFSQDRGKRRRSREMMKSPLFKLKFSREEIEPSPSSVLIGKTETQSPMPENSNGGRTDNPTTERNFNGNNTDLAESSDILSFHGENGEVYTLSCPPNSPELTQLRATQVDAPSVVCVKKGLISFLLEASPNGVGHMITQANNIFAFLQGMNAEYKSFYNKIRAYIGHCLEWYAAGQEQEKHKALETLVCRYDQLLRQSKEIEKDVLGVEDNIGKAKEYMAPLEARVEDMKELLEKLELELEERKNDLRTLEARKAHKVEELAAVDVELKATAANAEKSRGLIRDSIARREAAKISMENARNQLRII